MPGPDTTNRGVLTSSAYRDGTHLSARQRLYDAQTPRYDLPGMVLEHLPTASGRVLDVGCGNGTYVTRIREARPQLEVVGIDISEGILEGIAPPTVVADATDLPYADHETHAVLAMHMLYHVADHDAALSEFVRVLRPDGTLVASTNASHDKAALDDLWASAAADVLGVDVDDAPRRISLSSRFPLDTAPQVLERYFGEVQVRGLPGTISVDEPEPVLAHLNSYQAWAAEAGVPFDETMQRVRERLTNALDRDGVFTIQCHGGIVIGTEPRPEQG